VPVETEKQLVRQNLLQEIKEPTLSAVTDMSKMSPNELKKAFKKTYLSENKHLSTYEVAAANRYDTASDMSVDIEGFSASRDLSEMDAGVRPMEIKISFFDGDSGLSRDNYNLLSETASIVVNNPKRAVQIAIPESATHNKDSRKLAARRLAIVEQVLRDTGIAEQRIVPVLSQRDDDVFVLRIISGETFESLTQQKRNMSGSVSKKTYKNMSW
jgi:type IV pilus biogenesis protein CpaD/CtpE